VYDDGTPTTSTAMMTTTTITTRIRKIFAIASDENLNQFRLPVHEMNSTVVS
jgi:hypothetical protein